MNNNYVQCGDVGFKQNMLLKKIKIKDKNKKNFWTVVMPLHNPWSSQIFKDKNKKSLIDIS